MNKHTLSHMNGSGEMSIIAHPFIYHIAFHGKVYLMLFKSYKKPLIYGLKTNACLIPSAWGGKLRWECSENSLLL